MNEKGVVLPMYYLPCFPSDASSVTGVSVGIIQMYISIFLSQAYFLSQSLNSFAKTSSLIGHSFISPSCAVFLYNLLDSFGHWTGDPQCLTSGSKWSPYAAPEAVRRGSQLHIRDIAQILENHVVCATMQTGLPHPRELCFKSLEYLLLFLGDGDNHAAFWV